MDLADIMNVHTERRQDEDFRLKESTPTVQNANVRFQDCGQLRTAGSHERMLLTQHRAGTANRCTRTATITEEIKANMNLPGMQ